MTHKLSVGFENIELYEHIKVQNTEWELIDQSVELDNYKNFCAVTIRGVVYTFGNYFGNGEVFKFRFDLIFDLQ